jgi:hypothetical protein
MSRSIGSELPSELRGLFDGADLVSGEGLTILLLTSTQDGWPYQAMISVGELLAVDARRVKLALWPSSTATENLTRSGKATLTLVHQGIGYALRCLARRGADLEVEPGGPLAYFELQIEDILEDAVSYATLTSGVTYKLNEPEKVLPRWMATVAALRAIDDGR